MGEKTHPDACILTKKNREGSGGEGEVWVKGKCCTHVGKVSSASSAFEVI